MDIAVVDPVTLWLGLGGLVGAALRSIVTLDQKTLSKQTVVDVLIGGAVGMLYPLYPVIPFPDGASLLQRAVIMAMMAYSTSDFATSMFRRFQGDK